MDCLYDGLPATHARRTRPRLVHSSPGGVAHGTPWPLSASINVVLFSGFGGACQGLEKAGFPVHVAVNHDRVAIAAHRVLNPHTRHMQADIHEVCPLEATGYRPVNVLWASPDCTFHSVARGGQPVSPRVRSLPWQVCRWVGTLRRHGLGPSTVMLENVREIRAWGPLVAKRDPATGRVLHATPMRDQRTQKLSRTPLVRVARPGERVPRQHQLLVRDPRPGRAGRIWKAWVKHMIGLGVAWEDRDLCAADYGVPTSRRRLFGVGQCDGRPIVWPRVTHGPRQSDDVLSGRLAPYASAASILDWTLPMPSIFGRPKTLVPATMRRIAVGVARYVMRDGDDAFLFHLTHHGVRPGHRVIDAMPTITGAHRGEIAVAGAWLVQQQVAAAYLVHQRGTGTATSVGGPIRTLATGGDRGGDHIGIAAGFLAEYYGTGGQHQGLSDPLNTLPTVDRFAPTCASLAVEPLTEEQLAGARRVAAFLREQGVWDGDGDIVTVELHGRTWVIVDIGMRMLRPHEAAAAHELVMPGQVPVAGKSRPLTKTESMRLIGNSVPMRLPYLLASHNAVHPLALSPAMAAE